MHVIRVHIYKIFSIVLLTSNVIVTGIDLTTSLNNDMVQDAIVRRIEVIGEAVGRLPDSLKARYPDIPWQDIKDMRNKLIHDYGRVDLELVWAVIQDEIPELEVQVRRVIDECP